MILSTKRIPNDNILQMNRKSIRRKKLIKFLGIYLDERLI